MLVQCRPELIARTYEAIQGAPRAIVHFYNSTNPLQREVVFNLDKDGIKQVAIDGATMCKQHEAELVGTEIRYEYSQKASLSQNPTTP